MTDHREYSAPEGRGRHSAGPKTPPNQQRPSQASSEAGLTPQQVQANRLYEQRQTRAQQSPDTQRAQGAPRSAAQTQGQRAGRPQAAPSTQQPPRSAAPRKSVQSQQRSFSMPGKGGKPENSGNPGATFGVVDKQGQGKKKGGIWRVIFWIALIVFLVSLAALGIIGFSYWQEQNLYNDVANEAFEVPADISGTSLADLTVDWDALLAKNPDTVGWIYVPGTSVNYPIVHTTDNEKYLKTNFVGETNWVVSPGTIFLAAENKPDFSDQNNMVYGHHMNDGSMFAALDAFTDSAEFNSHRTIYILTPQGNYRLETFSMVICSADDPLAQTSFASAEEFQAYVQDKINRSVVTPDPNDVTAASVTKLFSFVTCDYSIYDGRAVLFASVVESTVASAPAEGEPTDAGEQTETNEEQTETGEEQADPSLIDPEDAATVGEAAEEYV